MELLVEDLLTYSHVSQKIMETEEIDLNDKIKKVREDLEVAIQEAGATFIVGHLPTVRGHRRQLQQLFHNLISNSIKYRKHDVAPEIKIISSEITGQQSGFDVSEEQKLKHYYLIEVSDNGLGFEQQYAEKIFQMFQRLHGKSEFSGTGVGLAIARKVVENHQGYIAAESEPGVGSTFKILLPV
jgi:light-regulated signal transduction histidine kinase (bacteriophytochrome)